MEPTTHRINLNTIYCSNKNKSNPSWNNPERIDNLTGVCVASFTSVNTIKNIDSRNNKIGLLTEVGGTVSNNVLTIPTANYTIDTFVSASSVIMNTVANFAVSLDTMANKITFASTACNFAFVPQSNNVYYETGIDDTQLNATTASFTTNSTYDLSGAKTINVVSSSFGTEFSKTLGENYAIIAQIPIDEAYMSTIHYSSNQDWISSNVRDFNNVSVQLYDDRMRALTMDRDWDLGLFLKSV